MHTELVFDRALTPDVRTRAWQHRGDRVPAWPVGSHADFEVAWPRRGALCYEIHGRTFDVPVGSAMFVPACVDHRTRIAPGTEATSLWIGRELVAEIAEVVGARVARFEPQVIAAAGLATLGQVLLAEAQHDMPGAFVTANALGEALVVQLLRGLGSRERAASGDPRVDAAIERIESSYADALSVDDLARAAGMSRYHFSRAFRARTGASPYQYLMRTRVKRAAELLRRGRRSVTEAAFEVGFGDLGRFSRAFQRELGVAPSRYRRHDSLSTGHESHFDARS
jgi:AraC-like DNA-binding protein